MIKLQIQDAQVKTKVKVGDKEYFGENIGTEEERVLV